MHEPYSLYVDEISQDEIKATVSNVNSYLSNLRVLQLLLQCPDRFEGSKDLLSFIDFYQFYLGEKINGIRIVPLGRFICMLTGSRGNRGMVLLDLMGRDELVEKIAEKLADVDLRDRFMEVYEEILDHPENHEKCEWVVGKAGWLGGPRR